MRKSRRWWLLGALPVAGIFGLGLAPRMVFRHLGVADAWVSAGLDVLVGAPSTNAAGSSSSTVPVSVRIDGRRPLRVLDPRFLSFAIDTSQLLGAKWWSASGRVEVGQGSERVAPLDLGNPALLRLTRALGPAYLRVGGTEADRVHYAFGSDAFDSDGQQLPEHGEDTLGAPTWDALNRFADAARLDLFFTINAGPSARSVSGAWQGENAETLLRYAQGQHQAVRVWELGNEVNAHWFMHGINHQPSGKQYAEDLILFHRLVKQYFPGALVAGPASAYFPRLGEPLPGSLDFLPQVLERAGSALDIVSWHFYPVQSRRCPVATRRVHPGQLLQPFELDEMDRWSATVRQARDRFAPSAELWLGETGGAQCGGEPGSSDRFASGLWWLDELGQAARAGQSVVVRQTLVGSDYGLIDAATLEPRPDYFNSLLWKHWMGPVVLGLQLSAPSPFLRFYAHCSPRDPETAVLLALNVDPEQARSFELEGGVERLQRFDLSAPALDSRQLFLNGAPLALEEDASELTLPERSLPELRGRAVAEPGALLSLPAASYSFFEIAGPIAAVCAASKTELARGVPAR